MKRTTSILVCTLAAGMAWAQNPQIIENTRAMMNSVQHKSTAASNEALGVKPAPAKPAAAKPATAPTKTTVAVKTTAAPAKATAKTTAAPSKAAIVPAKATASASKAAVVPVAAPVKASAPKVSAPKATAAKATPNSPKAEPLAQKKSTASASPKLGVKQLKVAKEIKPAGAQKEKKEKKAVAAAPKATAPAAAASSDATSASSSSQSASDDPVKDEQDKKWAMSGKRDPFISPVVSHAGGSGCSTGKKCLEIGAINLRGVVHSDGGFIAVVTNNLNKAYFLRENDPVFDGYVVKITGDSIIFKETVQDRLGKSFTREVTKKITTPAV
jgi:hypothetical protein